MLNLRAFIKLGTWENTDLNCIVTHFPSCFLHITKLLGESNASLVAGLHQVSHVNLVFFLYALN